MEIILESTRTVMEQDLEAKPDYITDARWDKIQTIKHIEDKKRSLLAGRLLHRMYEAIGIGDSVYATEKNGKPYLRNHPNVEFSISHSGEYAALVYHTDGTRIGIDIQQIRKMSEGIPKRILHPKERIPEELTEDEQNQYLNRVWAIKESYVKMTGDGLSQDFRKLFIDMEKGTVTDENDIEARFAEPMAPQGYVMAVSVMRNKDK